MENETPDTKTLLLQAALVSFADHGFDGTSIRMIADQAQRPMSLLSHHFGNKESLYQEVFRFIFMRLSPHRPAAAFPAPPEGPEEATAILMELIQSMYRDSSPDASAEEPLQDYATRLWLREIHDPRPSLHPLLVEYAGTRVADIKQCLQVLRPELQDPELIFLGTSLIAQALGHGMMRGLTRVLWGVGGSPGSASQASKLLVNQCLYGLLGVPAQKA